MKANTSLSLIFSLLYLVLHAYAIAHDQIHLQLHPGLKAKSRYVYNAILPYPHASTLHDGQIVDLAFAAHETMRDMHTRGRPARQSERESVKYNKELPNVITVVASGDHLFIASSMRGRNILYNERATVTPPGKGFWKTVNGVCHPAIDDGLRQCNKAFPGGEIVGHQNGGSCGEVMVAWAMCDIVGDAHLNPARVVAVEFRENAMRIKDPCGDDTPGSLTAKGCQTFNQHLGWRVIPTTTTVEAIGDLKFSASQIKYATYNFS